MNLFPHEIRQREKNAPRLEFQHFQMMGSTPEEDTTSSVPEWVKSTMNAPAYVPLFVAQPENRPRSLSQSSNASKSSDRSSGGQRRCSISDILGTHEDDAKSAVDNVPAGKQLQSPNQAQLRISNSSCVSNASMPSLASVAISLGPDRRSLNSRWSLSSADSNNIWTFDPTQTIVLRDESSPSDTPQAPPLLEEKVDVTPAQPTIRPLCPGVEPPLMEDLELPPSPPTGDTTRKTFVFNPNAQAFVGASDDKGCCEQETEDVEEKVPGFRFVPHHCEPEEPSAQQPTPRQLWLASPEYHPGGLATPEDPYAFNGIPSAESIHSHHSHNSFNGLHSVRSTFSSHSVARSTHSEHSQHSQPLLRSSLASTHSEHSSSSQFRQHRPDHSSFRGAANVHHMQSHRPAARSFPSSSVCSRDTAPIKHEPSASMHAPSEQPAPQRPPANLAEVIERKLVRNFAYEQLGSRYLQAALKRASPRDLRGAFDQLYADIVPLSDNVFGNYVIQKFVEHGSPRQRCEIAYKLRGHFFRLCRSAYGCRVVQKVLEFADTDTKLVVLDELVPYVDELVRDDNGNHVIQKVIREVPCGHLSAVYDCIQLKLFEYCTNMFGCRVVQRLLEHADGELMQTLMRMVLNDAYDLCRDAWGNYVVQHVLENGPAEARGEIIETVTPHVTDLSRHKFASNVVEKAFAFGSREHKRMLLEGLMRASDEKLLPVICDQFGNYVIQKALGVASELERAEFVARIETFESVLRGSPNGVRVLHKIQDIVAGDADTTS